MALLAAEAAGDEGGAGRDSQGDGVYGRSTLPNGALLVFMPTALVGEV
jgi:hypothetical protein